MEDHFFIKGIVGIMVLVMGSIAVASSTESIDVGERGLVIGFGQTKEVLAQGFHFVNPFYNVINFNIRNNKYEATAQAATSDLQKAAISVAINYNIDEQKISEIYTTYGSNYMDRIFVQNVQEAVKTVSAGYTAPELITKREQVKSDIKLKMQEMTANVILITDVAITNVDFSDAFDSAIESKVLAEQQAIKAQNELAIAKAEADKRVAQAKGEAEAIRIQAQAVTQQGGSDYVKLKWVEKWDGKVPEIMTGDSSNMMLNLK